MRVWPAGKYGDPALERGYVIIHTHTPVDRRSHVWHLIVSMPKGLMCKSDPSKTAISRFVETFPAVIAEDHRSEEHTSELQSLMRISYAVFCFKKKKNKQLKKV